MDAGADPAPARRWARADDVLWRHSFGDVIVLGGGAAGQPVRLNPTCAVLWQRLAQPATAAELTADLAARFDARPEGIGDEISAVLSHLAELGLVTQR